MFYVRIAIAVAVWVSIWNLSIKEKKKFFEVAKKYIKAFWRKCWFVLKRVLVLVVAWLNIYLVYLWIKWIWDSGILEPIRIILKFIGLYLGVMVIWCIPFLWLSWLASKEAEWKERRANKKLQEEQIERNLESLDLGEYEINEEDITEEDINKK